MIFGARISYEGPDGTYLVLDGEDGTRTLPISDEALGELDVALNPYRMHVLEGEVVQMERLAAGGISWDEFAQQSEDPGEQARYLADAARKLARES